MAHILVGVDGSEGGRAALARAVAEGRRTGATVEAVTCWYPPYVNGFESTPGLPTARAALVALDAAIRSLPADAPTVRRTVVEGRPASVLAELAQRADLLVVGAGDRRLRSRLLWGSLAKEVAQRTATVVEVVELVGAEAGGAPASAAGPVEAIEAVDAGRAGRRHHRPLRRRHAGRALVVR